MTVVSVISFDTDGLLICMIDGCKSSTIGSR